MLPEESAAPVDREVAVVPESQYPKEELILSTPLPYEKFQDRKRWKRIHLPRQFINTITSWLMLFPWGKSRLALWGIGGGITTMTVLVILVSLIFARVSLTLKPKVEEVALGNMILSLDNKVSGILVPQLVLPAELLIFKRSVAEDFVVSGRKFVEDRAKGRARVYNRFSSSPQSLVASTRFVTDSGVLYRTPKGITVPGARIEEGKIVPQFVEAELVADEAGEVGNLSGEVTLQIPGFKGSPKYEGFYAVAHAGFSGGFRGETAVVSREDIKRAEEGVTQKVYRELEDEMRRNIPEGFKILDSVREIQITNINVPGEMARLERFTAYTAASGRALIFKEEDVLELLQGFILKDDLTRKLIRSSASFSYQVSTVDFDKGRAVVALGGSIKTKAVLPHEEIAASVVGKKEGSMIEVLKNRGDLSAFKISFFPPWISKAPSDASKVRISVESPGD